MSTQVKWRRGTTAESDAFTGALAEITVDTDEKTLRVHDNVTPGGSPLANKKYVSGAQEELLPPGSQIYPDDGSVLANGMIVPSGITHLRVLVGGEPTIVAMSPVSSGAVSLLTDVGATVGVTDVNWKVNIGASNVINPNLISNSSFDVTGSVAIPPDATPRSYNAGDELFSGIFAAANLSNVTYVDGKLNGTGQLYVDVYKTEKQKLSTSNYVASIASSDGIPIESGASFTDNGDYWRITFDMNNTFSVKFEQSGVSTGHGVDYGVIATGSTAPRTLGDRFADVVNVRDFGAVGDGVTDDTAAIQASIEYAKTNDKKEVYIPAGIYDLTPVLRSDGTYVALLMNDENDESPGYNATTLKIRGDGNTVLRSDSFAGQHALLRWKASNSGISGVKFVGDRSYTTAIEISRASQDAAGNTGARSAESAYNVFDNLRFTTCNKGITAQGFVFYNDFNNTKYNQCNVCLEFTEMFQDGAVIPGPANEVSTVNRNTIRNLFTYGCTDGIRISGGDTNKFYHLSFEGCSGTCITMQDINPLNNYGRCTLNTFYGVNNEANEGLHLKDTCIVNANSYFDFSATPSKLEFDNTPAYFFQMGNVNSYELSKYFVRTDDQDEWSYRKNRHNFDGPVYANSISDNIGTDSDGYTKGYDWRRWSWDETDCSNVATMQFNSALSQALPIYKILGGVVHYLAAFEFTATDTMADIIIPVPYNGYDGILSFGNFPPFTFFVSHTTGSNTTAQPVTVEFDGTQFKLLVPSGGWSGSRNMISMNIQYPRQGLRTDFDTPYN